MGSLPYAVRTAASRMVSRVIGSTYWRSPAWVRVALRPVLRGGLGRIAAAAGGVGPAVAADLAAFHDTAVTPIPADWLHLTGTANWRGRREEIERGRFRISTGLPPVDVRPPLDWNSDPHKDRYWRITLSAWRMIDPYLVAADRGDQKSLDQIFSYVADWHRQHLVEGRQGPFTWYDMAVGLRAQILAYLVARARREPGALREDQVAVLVETATAHLERLLIPGAFGAGNHGLFQIHGLRALQAALEGVVDVGCPAQTADLMRVRLSEQFSPEGVHLEHSPAYHVMVGRAVRHFAASPWYAGIGLETGWTQRLEENEAWLTRPDGQLVPAGDSNPGRHKPRRWPADLQGVGRPVGRLFDAGVAVVRSPREVPLRAASMLYVSAASHSHVHKHSDDLSFEWFDRGGPIIVDAGKFGVAARRAEWQYVRSPCAHNVVEIEGESPDPYRRKPYGSGLTSLRERCGEWIVDGRVYFHATATEHRRQLRVLPGRRLRVHDRLRTNKPRAFTQWFHFPCSGEVAVDGNGVVVDLDHDRRVRVTPAVGAHVDVVCGATSPRWQGWHSPSYGRMHPAPAVGLTLRSCRRAVFETVLELLERPPHARP
jgi:Heparinase II/III-like protein